MNATKEVVDAILLLLAFISLIAAHARIDSLTERVKRLEQDGAPQEKE